jgi:hypothetical protein
LFLPPSKPAGMSGVVSFNFRCVGLSEVNDALNGLVA